MRRPQPSTPRRPSRAGWACRAAAAALLALALAPAARAQAPTWPSEVPPLPLPARDVQFPPYEIKTLANGLQVVAVMHHEQPVVSVRLLVRAGSAQDPADRQGLATLVAALLDQGTSSRSAQQIADTIDTIGGGLNVGAGSDLSYANVVVMKDSFTLGMDLLADVIRSPGFAPEEIERQRQQALSSLKVSYDDPDYVADMVFDRLVYGFHPYGYPNNGTPDSLRSLTREDLLAFHAKYFAPNNCLLAIVGDVTAAEAFAGAERAFGNWARKDIPADTFVEPPPSTRRVLVIDKPDSVQTEVRVGHLGIPRKHPEYMAMDLAIKILGGEGSNRLHRVLRSERGLTYGASADMETLKNSGDFVAETDTRSDATGEVLRLIVEEFSRLQRERVSQRELADAQAYLAGSFPLTIETPDAIATQVLNALFYELPLDELQTFRERVQAVAPDDIQRVARQYVKPDRLSVVLVGNASAFVNQLRGVGFPNFERVALADLDLMAVDFKRSGRGAPGQSGPSPAAARTAASPPPAPAASSPEPTERSSEAKVLIERVVDAMGGLEKLRAIKTVVASAQTRLMTPQGPLQADTRTYIEYPDRFRVDATLPNAEIIQTYDRGRAWMKDPGGVRDAPDQVREDFESSVRRDLVPLLIGAASGSLRVRALPEASGEGGAPLRVVEISGDGLSPVTLYVDPATYAVVRQTYQTRGPSGQETAEELFSDFRAVDGLQVAFKAVVRRGTAVVLERTVTDFKLNVPIDPAVFQKP